MRLRNVSGAKEKIEASKYIVLEPKENKGKWKKVFGNDNPIHIEIGMGKGKFIFEHALRDRDINFIGIEKFDSVMVRAIEKLEDVEVFHPDRLRDLTPLVIAQNNPFKSSTRETSMS